MNAKLEITFHGIKLHFICLDELEFNALRDTSERLIQLLNEADGQKTTISV